MPAAADCRWVSRGLKSYLKCTGDVPKVLGSATDALQDNIGKPVEENILKPIDRARIDLQAEALRPVVMNWIIESRNNALNAGTQPIPPEIYSSVRYFFDDALLRRVRYRVGEGHFLSLPSAVQKLGNRGAIALDYVIVFRRATGAANPVLWAHELTHLAQYRRWGISDFAVRYLRSWETVENEARGVETQFRQWLANGGPSADSVVRGVHSHKEVVVWNARQDVALEFQLLCGQEAANFMLHPSQGNTYTCPDNRSIGIRIATTGERGRQQLLRSYDLEPRKTYHLYWNESLAGWDVAETAQN
jgi:hypothetical protein